MDTWAHASPCSESGCPHSLLVKVTRAQPFPQSYDRRYPFVSTFQVNMSQSVRRIPPQSHQVVCNNCLCGNPCSLSKLSTPSPSPTHWPSSSSLFFCGARGKDGTDWLHRAAFNAASQGSKPGSPGEPLPSFLSRPLSAPLPHPGCPPRLLHRVTLPTPFTQHSLQQRQTSLEKGLDEAAHSLCSTKGAVSETLHQLAGQAPLCPLQLLPVRQPDG